jgi:hypothetical protein
MKKTQRKIISVSYLYRWYRFMLIYINFNFDFLGLYNVYFFWNYFANELIRYNTAAHVVNSTYYTYTVGTRQNTIWAVHVCKEDTEIRSSSAEVRSANEDLYACVCQSKDSKARFIRRILVASNAIN